MLGKWLRQMKSDCAIVFIHGLFSSSASAWKKENGAYWPDLIISESRIEQHGVYIFDYQTSLFSNYSISDASEAFFEYLKIDGLLDAKRIIVVAHSMGGLVARRMLLQKQHDFISRKIQVGLFLIASPSLGSQYADFFTKIGLVQHVQVDTLRFIQNNTWISDLDSDFRDLKESLKLNLSGRELVETDPVSFFMGIFRKKIVLPISAARYFGNDIKIPKTDHFSIAKPASKDSLQHRILVDFIIEKTTTQIYLQDQARNISLDLKQRLENLHAAQSNEVNSLGFNAERPRFLSDIVALSGRAISAVIPDFKHHASDAGSWIASHSLALQLLTQSHLTVDLTVEELEQERPFGMPFDSLIDLTSMNFLSLNLRDYDSQKTAGFPDYGDEEKLVGRRIGKLLQKLPRNIYIGSAVRRPVFQAALHNSGIDKDYEETHDKARSDLKQAHGFFLKLPPDSEAVVSSRFRGANPSIDAVCWHRAFLDSVRYFIPEDINVEIDRIYHEAVEKADGARDEKSQKEAGIAFAVLARQYRIYHLNFTAPLTASHGTVFNMTQDEHELSLQMKCYWRSHESKSDITDEQVRRFMYYVLSEKGRFDHPTFERIRELPNNYVFKRAVDRNMLTRGHIDAFIGALVKNKPNIEACREILKNLEVEYLSDREPSPEQLARLIDEYRKIKAGGMQVFERNLKDIFSEIVTPEMGVAPILPSAYGSIAPGADGYIKEAAEGFLRRREQRIVYRVFQTFHPTN